MSVKELCLFAEKLRESIKSVGPKIFFSFWLHYICVTASSARLKWTSLHITYWVERVVLLEALFKNDGLVLGEPELLSRGFTVFFITDTSRAIPLKIMLFPVSFSLASLSAQARYRAIGGWNASFFFAIARGRQPVHVDASEERSSLCTTRFRVSAYKIKLEVRTSEKDLSLGREADLKNRKCMICEKVAICVGFGCER